jgi:hypothetical protein
VPHARRLIDIRAGWRGWMCWPNAEYSPKQTPVQSCPAPWIPPSTRGYARVPGFRVSTAARVVRGGVGYSWVPMLR